MTCAEIAAKDIIDRYVSQSLPEDIQAEFEEHYFACASCASLLSAALTVKEAAGSTSRPVRSRYRWLAALALAAGVLLAVVGFLVSRSAAPRATAAGPATASTPAVTAAIHPIAVEPAPWSESSWRGPSASTDNAAFREAMRDYAGHRWQQSADKLHAITNVPAARHFEGVCLLLLNRPAEALPLFDGIIARGADTPFEEEARYYRALALANSGRTSEARDELRRVVALRGDYESKAQRLLNGM